MSLAVSTHPALKAAFVVEFCYKFITIGSSFYLGYYSCKCCAHPLFSSQAKFEHSSPWPAFTKTMQNDSLSKKLESKGAYKVNWWNDALSKLFLCHFFFVFCWSCVFFQNVLLLDKFCVFSGWVHVFGGNSTRPGIISLDTPETPRTCNIPIPSDDCFFIFIINIFDPTLLKKICPFYFIHLLCLVFNLNSFLLFVSYTYWVDFSDSFSYLDQLFFFFLITFLTSMLIIDKSTI